MHDNGFEVRHEENLREHYALTTGRVVGATSTRTGTRRSPRSAWARPGSGGSTWPASGSASTANQIQLHQVLGVKLDAAGRSGMPLRPTWLG